MKLLIGGSPCTHWSIAQTKNRETEASGIGWELFLNYRIARDKYKPDSFLYENNKSMSPAIRTQITAELGVEPVLINSALLSAQNRQRLYWVGRRNQDGTYSQVAVEQPEDHGILLRDILETGEAWREKAYTLDAHYYKTAGLYDPTKQHSYSLLMAAESVGIAINTCGEKSHTLKAQYFKNGIANFITNGGYDATAIAEPARIATIESDAKNADFDSQQYRVYSPDGKSVTLCGNGGGVGAKTGLYAVPWNGKTYHVYEVKDGLITIKDKRYPIKLRDGCYIMPYAHAGESIDADVVISDIKGMKAADVAPVRHGDWEIVLGSNGNEYMVCTCCRVSQDLTGVFTYCPNCGAKMDGEP